MRLLLLIFTPLELTEEGATSSGLSARMSEGIVFLFPSFAAAGEIVSDEGTPVPFTWVSDGAAFSLHTFFVAED